MADVQEVFRILKDGSDNGTATDLAIDATTAAAALQGLVGFAFKDSTGKVILPQLTADGKLPVDTEAFGGTCRNAKGEHAGSTSLVDVTGAEITITGGVSANQIEATVSCLRTALFQIVYVDDADVTPVETVISECLVGAGQYSFKMGGRCLVQDVSGGTGTQKIKLKAENVGPGAVVSTLRGTIWANDSAGS
jgi:hypothetical protein